MNNFIYYNPVKIVFGKDTITELKNLIPKNKKILILTDKNIITKTNAYIQIKEALKEYYSTTYSDIFPNPTHQDCLKVLSFAKMHKIDFILAVGGGSVIDAAKYISVAYYIKGSPWDTIMNGTFYIKTPELKEGLDFGCIVTLPATSSEMNSWAAISNEDTKEKFAFTSPLIFPKFSILDPEITYSLPKKQLINGIVDTYIHVLEQYLTYNVNAILQDRQAEALLLSLREEGINALSDIPDYNNRANLVWIATNAYNSIISRGVPVDWATHMIGHELTALYGIDHAESIAIVLPRLLNRQKSTKTEKILLYADKILNIDISDPLTAIPQAIDETEKYFQQIGMKTRLVDYNINAFECAACISNRFEERGIILGENSDITPEIVKNILESC